MYYSKISRQLPSATSKPCFPRQRRLTVYMSQTSSVSTTTSKQCFAQPVASFLVCALIFVEYKGKYSELK
ncbi:S1 RNA-binding domain-containing protein [Streptococcus pneumoniae]|nr:S1 RNA-binding domain-containing protein [Streptococcus pneumoniae]